MLNCVEIPQSLPQIGLLQKAVCKMAANCHLHSSILSKVIFHANVVLPECQIW